MHKDRLHLLWPQPQSPSTCSVGWYGWGHNYWESFLTHLSIIWFSLTICPNGLKTMITPHRGCTVCIDITRVWHIQACHQIAMTYLDVPYHCDINTHTAQPLCGIIIVFKPLGHFEYIQNVLHNFKQKIIKTPNFFKILLSCWLFETLKYCHCSCLCGRLILQVPVQHKRRMYTRCICPVSGDDWW